MNTQEIDLIEHLTDLGNAKRLATLHGLELHYCKPWGCWLIWTGTYWQKDEIGQVERRAKETIRTIYEEAAHFSESEKRVEISKWAQRSESAEKIRAMIALAKSEPGIPILPDDLDSESTNWLLNCQNGTVDLKTGELKAQDPQDLITRIIPVHYIPDARAPRFEQFISEIFDNDQDLISYIQKVLGYALTGSVKERILFFLYGEGKNGKTKLMNLLMRLLGPYAQKAAANLFREKRNDEHPTAIADLKGSRVVVCNETSANGKMAEALVKEHTGGDERLKARYMRQDYFDFTPVYKIFMYGNHKPIIKGRDQAIWDRIKLIPFNIRFEGDKEDKNLEEKLNTELSGVLAWCVRGCLLWQKEGLGEPLEVSEAIQTYRAEMDALNDFLNERCKFESAATVLSDDLFKNYVEWADEAGERFPMSRKDFLSALHERGLIKKRATTGDFKGRFCIFGLGFSNQVSSEGVNHSE